MIFEERAQTEIRISGRFELRIRGKQTSLLGENPDDAAQACILTGKTLKRAIARGDGSLVIDFADEGGLEVPTDSEYEAWEASTTDGQILVSLPGGGLAIWRGRRDRPDS